jgi:hypothetical protein
VHLFTICLKGGIIINNYELNNEFIITFIFSIMISI